MQVTCIRLFPDLGSTKQPYSHLDDQIVVVFYAAGIREVSSPESIHIRLVACLELEISRVSPPLPSTSF